MKSQESELKYSSQQEVSAVFGPVYRIARIKNEIYIDFGQPSYNGAITVSRVVMPIDSAKELGDDLNKCCSVKKASKKSVKKTDSKGK